MIHQANNLYLTAEIISNNNGYLELYIIDKRYFIVASADKHNQYLKDKLVKGTIIRVLLTKDNKIKKLII